MNCANYRMLMSAYIDHELSDEEAYALKTHLQSCAACVGHLQKMERLHTAFQRYTLVQEQPAVPSAFAQHVMARIQATVTVPPSWQRRAAARGRAFVIAFTAHWAHSLTRQPLAWTAACAGVCLFAAGVLLTDVATRLNAPTAPEMQANVIAPSPQAQGVDTLVKSAKTVQLALASQADEQMEGDVFEATEALNGNSLIRIAKHVAGLADVEEAASAAFVDSEAELQDGSPRASANRENVIRQDARQKNGNLQEYIYSHILESYQDYAMDDVMFVGYAQDASSH